MGSWNENQRAVTNHSAASELKGESEWKVSGSLTSGSTQEKAVRLCAGMNFCQVNPSEKLGLQRLLPLPI